MDRGVVVGSFTYDEVDTTQIDPAAAVAKPANIRLLADLLGQSFFFDTVGSSGEITGAFSLSGEETVAIVSSPTATLSVPNIDEISIIRLEPTMNVILQGIDSTGITTQQTFLLINQSAYSVTIPEENVNPAPADRFRMAGTSKTLAAGATIWMIYDLTINRFRLI
jgi:hypothetical protein